MRKSLAILFIAFSLACIPQSNAFAISTHSRTKLSSKALIPKKRRNGLIAKVDISPLFFFRFGEDGDDPDRFIKEVFQMNKISADLSKYDALVLYLNEWAQTLLHTKGSDGLTTPVQVESTDEGVLIRFAPKQPTGKKYMSKKEEKEVEKRSLKEFEKTGRKAKTALMEIKDEGGVEVFVLKDETLSVHAKRFNYGEDVAVKEMSEETILNRLKEALMSWKAEHP